MRAQFDKSHERHEDETTRWQKKEAALNRKVNTNDRAILQENQTLRDELVRAREQQDKAEEKAKRREEKARREAERAAELEHVKLMEEKEQLQLELEQAKESRQAEINRWKSKQAELQAHIDQREETIHQLRVSVPQEQINDDLRMENQDLKAELASLKVSRPSVEEQGTPKETLRKRLEEVTNQHVEANQRWTRKESRLYEKLEQVKEANDLYRELDTVREQTKTTRSTAHASAKRRSADQIDMSVSDALHAQTAREYPNTRSRSKSQSRRLPRNFRHVSAPVMTQSEDEASISHASTTDLSFDPAILAGAPRSGGKGKRATGFVPVQAHTEDDVTFLSFTPEIEIANLRKRVEEEHLAARQQKASVGASRAIEDETTGYGRRHNSFKDNLTARSRASSRARSVLSAHADNTEDEFAIEEVTSRSRKNDTMRSHISRTSRASHQSRSRSRRRSSATFQEMTSAFIIPDITMHTRDGTINTKELKGMSHDTKNCSVCQRILSSSPVDIEDLNIPAAIPVTTRETYKNDIDATLRPAQAPAKALSQVIKELQDELQHLQLEFSVLQSRQQSTDPAMGARLRAALHKKIDRVHKMIQVKEKQIYSLYDVCEAHKIDLAGEEEGTELPEEVERTLENVLEARGRRVEFEDGEDEGSEWMGIGDTTGF
jgi:DNA repair exonuclease SbcCD ATPase subunit